jgi:hypothetical protein
MSDDKNPSDDNNPMATGCAWFFVVVFAVFVAWVGQVIGVIFFLPSGNPLVQNCCSFFGFSAVIIMASMAFNANKR